jgi:hypothetical protein
LGPAGDIIKDGLLSLLVELEPTPSDAAQDSHPEQSTGLVVDVIRDVALGLLFESAPAASEPAAAPALERADQLEPDKQAEQPPSLGLGGDMIRDNADYTTEPIASEDVGETDVSSLVSEPQPEESAPLAPLGSDTITDDAHVATEMAVSEDTRDISQLGGERERAGHSEEPAPFAALGSDIIRDAVDFGLTGIHRKILGRST